jgi:glycerol-3-phosphate acyltransferase PlsX
MRYAIIPTNKGHIIMEQYKVVIDTLGSDKGPEAIILGAALALKQFPELFVTLVGPQALIDEKILEHGIDVTRLKVIPAEETIVNTDHAYEGIMTKTEASLTKAFKEVAKDEENYVGMMTAGNSGAILMGSFRYLRTNSFTRPCMAAIMPNAADGFTCLVDTGATIDCTVSQLHSFAKLGSELMSKLYGIESPRIGLLSNGAEPTKGNALGKETFPVLAADSTLNFVGNIEGNRSLSGDCDVLVCDGFAGNQVLKNTEGTAAKIIKDIVVLSKTRNEPKYMEVVDYLMKRYDLGALGGGLVLGVRKLVIKARGNSDERAIVSIARMLINHAKGGAFYTKKDLK